MSGKPTPRSQKVINDPSTHQETLRTAQVVGWRKEISGKVHVYPGDVESYLRNLVPSQTPCPVPPPDLSSSWEPEVGKEKESYGPLLDILTALVAEFPDDKRPTFYGGHDQKIHFPFTEFAHKHHTSKPDLAVSFPGDKLPKRIEKPDWSRFSMVIEAKDLASKDPFVASSRTAPSKDRAEKLVQLAVNARGLMFAHGFLAAFTLGIYGDVVRIARFDHASAVVSPLISLKSVAGLRTIQEFFWRFVHPWEGGPRAVVGSDPTIRQLTVDDTTWLKARLGSEADDFLCEVDIREARWVKVWDGDKPDDHRAFILFRLLDVNARLFSRSTMVWLGIEDTRLRNPSSSGSVEEDGEVELRVIKEAWRQVIRTPEQTFYERLKASTIDSAERIGLPDLLHGGDLGARDVKRWRAACAGEAWAGDDDLLELQSASSRSSSSEAAIVVPASLFSTASAFDSGSSASSSSLHPDVNADATGDGDPTSSESMPAIPEYAFPRPLHQTWSWRLGLADLKGHAKERSHMRFVMDTVGTPISRFKTTKDLVMAVRDAIKGHRVALERGGILHRDVSSGNILIVERPPRNRPNCKGILHDFDYSSMTLEIPSDSTPTSASQSFVLYPLESIMEDKPEDGQDSEGEHKDQLQDIADLKERTGTYYFIAIDLLDPELDIVIHDVTHDLESFFWVLLWVAIRHTKNDHQAKSKACSKIFKFGDDEGATAAKARFLQRKVRLNIIGNAPLTDLLERFRSIVHEASSGSEDKRCPLTYDAILNLFDKAIEREDWPVNDKAIPFVPPDTDVDDMPPTVIEGAIKAKDKKRRRASPFEECESELVSGATMDSSVAATVASKKQRTQQAASNPSGRSRRSRAKEPKTASGRGKASGGKSGRGSGTGTAS